MKLHIIFLIVLLLIGILAVSGCVPSETGSNVSGTTESEEDENGEDEGDGEGIPSSDQVSGTEPFPRYPGAVMISYTVMEGITSAIIEYKTLSDFETVKDWYMSQKAWPEITTDEPEQITIREITETEYLEVAISSISLLSGVKATLIGVLWYTE